MANSGGTLTPPVVVVVDPGASWGSVFGHSRAICPLDGVSCVRVAPYPPRRALVA